MMNLIKLFRTRKKLLQHECLTPIKSGITLSQILEIQKIEHFKNIKWDSHCYFDKITEQSTIVCWLRLAEMLQSAGFSVLHHVNFLNSFCFLIFRNLSLI